MKLEEWGSLEAEMHEKERKHEGRMKKVREGEREQLFNKRL